MPRLNGFIATEWQGRLLVEVELKEGFGGQMGFGHAGLGSGGERKK